MSEFLVPGPIQETSTAMSKSIVDQAYENHRIGLAALCPTEEEVKARAHEIIEVQRAFDRLPGFKKLLLIIRDLPNVLSTPSISDRDRFGA